MEREPKTVSLSRSSAEAALQSVLSLSSKNEDGYQWLLDRDRVDSRSSTSSSSDRIKNPFRGVTVSAETLDEALVVGVQLTEDIRQDGLFVPYAMQSGCTMGRILFPQDFNPILTAAGVQNLPELEFSMLRFVHLLDEPNVVRTSARLTDGSIILAMNWYTAFGCVATHAVYVAPFEPDEAPTRILSDMMACRDCPFCIERNTPCDCSIDARVRFWTSPVTFSGWPDFVTLQHNLKEMTYPSETLVRSGRGESVLSVGYEVTLSLGRRNPVGQTLKSNFAMRVLEASSSPRDDTQFGYVEEGNFTLHPQTAAFCEICEKSFSTMSNLRRHQRALHNAPLTLERSAEERRTASKETPKHYCSLCRIEFCQRSNLLRHIAVVHEKKRPFKCKYCDIYFTNKENRTRHERTLHRSESE